MPYARLISRLWFALQYVAEKQKLPVILTCIGAFALVSSTIIYTVWSVKLNDMLALNASLIVQVPVIVETAPESAKQGLHEFRSSHLVGLLQESAALAAVTIKEIAFTVESPQAQPFIRYRANFEVTAPYPIVRKFISHVLAGTSGAVLDSVSCTRKDISESNVSCMLSVYVAYRRENV